MAPPRREATAAVGGCAGAGSRALSGAMVGLVDDGWSDGLSRSPLRVVVLSILSDLLQPGWQELPPWFWERQNSTRRHSGQARVEQLDHGR